MKTIILHKKNIRHTFNINPEKPFLKISAIELPEKLEKNNLISSPEFSDVIIKIKKSGDSDIDTEEYVLFDGRSFSTRPENNIVHFKEAQVDNNKFNKVELIYENKGEWDIYIQIHYITSNNNVPLENPFENFNRHILEKDNVKILFSAPFGQGKTTFLNYFFEQHIDEYEVFNVFPVNYSISHNEDVFKYIKAEILFQLFKKDVEFDKESFSYFLTAPQFFKNNPTRVLAPLLILLPKIGKSAYDIYDTFYNLAKEYFDYHDKTEINDKAKAEKFIDELYEKEGSIFEDNFYTQLIRQQLEKLKLSSKKQNVLIIEDLDRMDPDHIFRILNIFAAHFDTLEYEGYANKFAFDKIIVVGDYYNIKHTFAYRYGPNVNFEGYINKYYSNERFNYDNNEAIASLIKDLRKGIQNGQDYAGLELLISVLNDLVEEECITLRDLLKISKTSVISHIIKTSHHNNTRAKRLYHLFIPFNLFFFLTKVFDIDSLIQKFEKCKTQPDSKFNVNYHRYAVWGLPGLVVNEKGEGEYKLKYKKITFTFIAKFEWNATNGYEYYSATEIKALSDDQEPFSKFSKSDFYEILILNAQLYKQVGGFK